MVQQANSWLFSDMALMTENPLSVSYHCEHLKTGQRGLICLFKDPGHINLLNEQVNALKNNPLFSDDDLLEVCANQNNLSYFVVRRKPGVTLRELISKKGTLDAKSAYRLFIRITQSLAKLHKAGFVHKALSPESIYIQQDGVDLCHFQYSESLMENKRADKLVMPLEYTAPELFYGHFSRASDIYSLGLILRYMHTGLEPYHFSEESSLAYRPVAHVLETLRLPGNTHTLIRQLILNCCAKKVDTRPSVIQIAKQSYTKKPLPDNDTLKTFSQIRHEFSFLRYGAMQGIPFCQLQLGQELIHKHRPDEAEYWLNKASGFGYNTAMYLLAKASAYRMPATQVAPMMELAYKKGNDNAGYWLANAMISGDLPNQAKGLELLKTVAESGDRRAMFKLGLIFQSSSKMKGQARHYVMQAAQRGYEPANEWLISAQAS